MKRGWIWIVFAVGCAGGMAEDRGMEGVPKPAVESLRNQANGVAIQRVDREMERGVETWEAVWFVDGVRHEAKVNAAGVVLEVEVEVAERDVPPAVRATAERVVGKGAKYERQMDGTYEAEVIVAGREREARIDANGRLVRGDEEGDDDDDDDDDDGAGEDD